MKPSPIQPNHVRGALLHEARRRRRVRLKLRKFRLRLLLKGLKFCRGSTCDSISLCFCRNTNFACPPNANNLHLRPAAADLQLSVEVREAVRRALLHEARRSRSVRLKLRELRLGLLLKGLRYLFFRLQKSTCDFTSPCYC